MTRKRQKDDPLAGVRQALNEGRLRSLLWDDNGDDAPVKVGDHFPLRSCDVTITKVHRIKRDRKRYWRAEFDRYVPDRLYLLARGAGDGRGYVEDPDLAQRAQGPDDDAEPEASSPAELDAGLVGGNTRPPPEPEAVPPHEIEHYTGSKVARARYEAEIEEERAREREEPLASRIATITARAEERHVDISGDLFVIGQRIEKGDRLGAEKRIEMTEKHLAA